MDIKVRIFKPAKNPMQSGTAGIKRYFVNKKFTVKKEMENLIPLEV